MSRQVKKPASRTATKKADVVLCQACRGVPEGACSRCGGDGQDPDMSDCRCDCCGGSGQCDACGGSGGRKDLMGAHAPKARPKKTRHP